MLQPVEEILDEHVLAHLLGQLEGELGWRLWRPQRLGHAVDHGAAFAIWLQ